MEYPQGIEDITPRNFLKMKQETWVSIFSYEPFFSKIIYLEVNNEKKGIILTQRMPLFSFFPSKYIILEKKMVFSK